MIHNNFRKWVKRKIGAGASTSDSDSPIIRDYIDIYGYTGTSSDALSFQAPAVNINAYSNYNNYVLSNLLKVTSTSSSTPVACMFAVPAKQQENEPDYYVGQTIDGLIYSTTRNLDNGNVFIITTVFNGTNADISYDEIGLIFHAGKAANGWNNKKFVNLLFAKEKLDALKIIPAQSSISITFNLFNDLELNIEQ